MGQVCSMIWNAQPVVGRGKKKLLAPVDFMSRKNKKARSALLTPEQKSASLDRRLAAYQRRYDKAHGKKDK